MGGSARSEGWAGVRGGEGEWIGEVDDLGLFEECGVGGRAYA